MNITGSKLDMTFASKSDVEMVEQQKQEFKLLGTYLRTKGMNLYCYNPHKDSVELVEFKKSKKLHTCNKLQRFSCRGLR